MYKGFMSAVMMDAGMGDRDGLGVDSAVMMGVHDQGVVPSAGIAMPPRGDGRSGGITATTMPVSKPCMVGSSRQHSEARWHDSEPDSNVTPQIY